MGFDVPIEITMPFPDVSEDGRKARLMKLFERLSVTEQDEIISEIIETCSCSERCINNSIKDTN